MAKDFSSLASSSSYLNPGPPSHSCFSLAKLHKLNLCTSFCSSLVINRLFFLHFKYLNWTLSQFFKPLSGCTFLELSQRVYLILVFPCVVFGNSCDSCDSSLVSLEVFPQHKSCWSCRQLLYITLFLFLLFFYVYPI